MMMHVEQGRKKCEDKMPEGKNTPSIGRIERKPMWWFNTCKLLID